MARMNWNRPSYNPQKTYESAFPVAKYGNGIRSPKLKQLTETRTKFTKYTQPLILSGEQGLPCPVCNKLSQVRKHKKITAEQLSKYFYYERWFYCTNKNCATTTFYDQKYKVRNQKNHNSKDKTWK